MEECLAGSSESLRPRHPPLPGLPLRRGRSLLADSGIEAAQRRSVGTALRPVAGVHAASEVACESWRAQKDPGLPVRPKVPRPIAGAAQNALCRTPTCRCPRKRATSVLPRRPRQPRARANTS
eukprot:3435994-Heterocapsa_arctica.AAC.1